MSNDICSSIDNSVVNRAKKTKLPVVFLGGLCKENQWREDLKKEYGKDIFFIDPYDENYDPSLNTYFEIAGMLKSDYVIFYEGGIQSEREQDFLKLINDKDIEIKKFSELEPLKKYLNKIVNSKLVNLGSKIRKCASLMKYAFPHVKTPHSSEDHVMDLHFEYLDKKSQAEAARDILEGKTVSIPKSIEAPIAYGHFSLNDIDKQAEVLLLSFLNKAILGVSEHDKDNVPKIFKYDKARRIYVDNRVKTAKENEPKYSYACLMIPLPEYLTKKVIEWGMENVKDKNLYNDDTNTMGREDKIHITVFYGIKGNVSIEEIKKLIANIKPFNVRLGLINIFKDNDKHDVLKIEVESGELERLHYKIENKVDNDNKYPTYNPHVTIAYINKGAADKYIGDDTFKDIEFSVEKFVYSTIDNKEIEIDLK